ncbi:dethiobiotin synthase [Gottschalkiaceae bacterium SANA]|nr:dethiobiotin synthase [Gottschalkiaceae bacterium SANA]
MIRFIVGTDTDAGKTFYGRQLARKGACVIKPIETGFNSFKDISQSDAYGYSEIMGKNLEEINTYFFTVPASPHLAAEIDQVQVDVDRVKVFILTQYRKCCEKNKKDGSCLSFFVELAGGLMVPLTRSFNQLDLIREINEEEEVGVDLVVGNKLGCINHALMTITLLRNANIRIQHLEINNYGKRPDLIMLDNAKVIREYLQSN